MSGMRACAPAPGRAGGSAPLDVHQDVRQCRIIMFLRAEYLLCTHVFIDLPQPSEGTPLEVPPTTYLQCGLAPGW